MPLLPYEMDWELQQHCLHERHDHGNEVRLAAVADEERQRVEATRAKQGRPAHKRVSARLDCAKA